jgi:hypothetical protein
MLCPPTGALEFPAPGVPVELVLPPELGSVLVCEPLEWLPAWGPSLI